MKTITLTSILATALSMIASIGLAQSYDFEYEAATYSELTGATVIEVPAEGYFLDLNKEKFLCFSEIYRANGDDGFKISREGSFQLLKDGTKATFLFSGGFVLRDDTEISYLIEGQKKDTNRVIKVQYENVGFNYGEEAEYMNFQIWVYPNTGDFEAHVGSFLVNTNGSSYSTGTSAWGPATGVIRMDTAYNFLNIITLADNPSNPDIRRGDFRLLGDTPAEGAILKFKNQAPAIDHTIPGDDDDDDGDQGNGGSPMNWPVGLDDGPHAPLLVYGYPNPATQQITFEFSQEFIKTDPILFDVIALDGRRVTQISTQQMTDQKIRLNVSDWPSGIYILSGKDHPEMFSRFQVVH